MIVQLNLKLSEGTHLWLISGFAARVTRQMPLMKQELLTLLEHLSSVSVLVESVLFMMSNYMSFRFKFYIVCGEVHVIYMLFIFIYVYWCPLWFLYQMIFVWECHRWGRYLLGFSFVDNYLSFCRFLFAIV